jgi:hypothetical protein
MHSSYTLRNDKENKDYCHAVTKWSLNKITPVLLTRTGVTTKLVLRILNYA